MHRLTRKSTAFRPAVGARAVGMAVADLVGPERCSGAAVSGGCGGGLVGQAACTRTDRSARRVSRRPQRVAEHAH